MNRIKILANRFVMWWVLHFRNKKLKVVEFDAYKVTFRRFTMEVTTKSGNMKLRTACMQYPQGYLLYCLEHGSEQQVEWFCRTIYRLVSLLTQDQGFADDVIRAFAKYAKRMEKKAESLAKAVSEEDDNIALEQVKFNQEYAKMSKKERKAYKEAMREELRKEE